MIQSLLNTTDTIHSLADLQVWIERRNREVEVQVEEIPFAQMRGWQVAEDGSLRHDSGKFFTIQGVHVTEENHGPVKEWDQPIINQPEVGYLGILTKEIDDCLYFLMQAKIEPGNVNCVQISPTLQATKSNYTQQHKGKKPAYLDYFMHAKPSQILLDQLQSEQGARFLRKRNRNIIIKMDEEVPVLEDFAWMTLEQIKEMLLHNNMVNMDTRTVLAGIDFAQYLTPNQQSLQIAEEYAHFYGFNTAFRMGYRTYALIEASQMSISDKHRMKWKILAAHSWVGMILWNMIRRTLGMK